MNEQHERTLRRKAIRLTLRGFPRRQILQRIPRGHTWLAKWQHRFATHGWSGLASQPRLPHHLTRRYSDRVRHLVVQARLRLLQRTVGTIGTTAIQTELRRARLLRSIPSHSTIQRILHEAGLLKPPRPRAPVPFPHPTPSASYVLHAMDWTARYLTGGSKVFAFHTIDLETRAMHQTISTNKTVRTVRQHALEVWQALGLPDALQMDNDAAFCGGYKMPRVFGQFVRLCLYLGIEPIFIPVREPERNGIVEQLNGVWSRTFWQRRRFQTVAQVRRSSPAFARWYSEQYRPPSLKGQSVSEVHGQAERVRLSAQRAAEVPERLPLTEGRVHFIRRVDEQGRVMLLNETWSLSKRLAGKYVWATVSPHLQRMAVYYRRSPSEKLRLVKAFHYALHEEVVPLLPAFKRRPRRRQMSTMC